MTKFENGIGWVDIYVAYVYVYEKMYINKFKNKNNKVSLSEEKSNQASMLIVE